MKFLEFKIKNFKGIEDITFKLDTSPNANIYTLVGLNESGKTTILEAINYFTATDKNLNSLELPGSVVKNYNDLIPISKRDNFNDRIEIIVKTLLEETDKAIIQDFVKINTPFKKVLITDGIINYFNYYNFKNSDFTKFEQFWTGFSGTLKTSQRDNFKSIGQNFQPEVNFSLFSLCKTLIPNILYFPNFLFDFPSRIYLETKEPANPKEKFYIDLI